jgi:Pyruvate:ferredoxin oxidoreductase and related 2-oxoacid:ferredoxin oxidoreductases, alpha subunit
LKKLMKGNEAIAEAAIQAGCKCYFGYPITPQNEVPEYMSWRLREMGGIFKQAESEVASVNMVYGAGAAGVRAMTSSSGLGIALMQEGITNLASTQVPAVFLNVMRGGPGLGTIQASQADYNQMTRGGGNGDYYLPTYAPATLQEACDLIQKAFDTAFKYRTPVGVMVDATIGNMMESVDIKENVQPDPSIPDVNEWCIRGGRREDGSVHRIKGLFNVPEECEAFNEELAKKYDKIRENEVMVDIKDCEGADVVIVAYGTTARIAKQTMKLGKENGLKIGMVRPQTVWPFPYDELREACRDAKGVLCAEMAIDQLLQDVQLALEGTKPIATYHRLSGVMPSANDMYDACVKLAKEAK